jgi:DnaJ-class molecular chaperone
VDLDRCFQVLEIDRHASIEEAKQAYKDAVSVWHPDRFSEYPRLRAKAEKKLKEINAAYERVQSHLGSSSEQGTTGKPEMGAKGASSHQYGVKGEAKVGSGARTDPPDLTEAVFEVGTRLVLTFWSYLAKRFHEAIEGEATSSESKRGAGSK